MSTTANSRAAAWTPRHQLLWDLHDFGQGRGLEIGPLHNATATPDNSDVRYADITDRDGLVAHYQGDPRVDPDLIPEVHYPLTDRDGTIHSLRDAAAPGAPYDWVMASHVIEHVPNLISWLAEIADLTADGGRLVLAVPDRRYCFDAHRPPTTVGQMLQAYEHGDVRPSIRAIYDAFRSNVTVDTPEAWQGRPPVYAARTRSLDSVREHLDRARAGEYVDCHVWTFTPDSILDQIAELRTLGLCSWVAERIEPTRRNALEFYLILRRLPRDGQGAAEMLAAEPKPASADMPDWLDDLTTAKAAAHEARARDAVPASGSGTAHLNASATGTVPITFPRGRFATPPRLVATVRSSGLDFYVVTGAVTSQGANVTVAHRRGAKEDATVAFDWIAFPDC